MSDKKDLTGIHHAPKKDENDPFQPVEASEQIDDFASIDQLGMIDHPATSTTHDPFTPPLSTSQGLDSTPDQPFNPQAEPTFVTEITEVKAPANPSPSAIEEIREYAEQAQSFSDVLPIFYPFNLNIRGRFGPYDRDKLLLFITENAIGLSSSDLDLQIKSGKVFLPRISEYAGIRLIQDLRDSGLELGLNASSRDHDERTESSPSIQFHYNASGASSAIPFSIPILPASAESIALYDAFDSIQGNQYLKAEMVEAEKSELFQEVAERMVESLKQKARLKGADALTHFTQKITPLRLPSQYQISVEATMLRKK